MTEAFIHEAGEKVPKPTWRYSNRDIEADYARLHEIARRYLVHYSGTFDPMRAAKNVVYSGDMLGIDQLRIVCNCLIQDFYVVGMPEPMGHLVTFDAGEVSSEGDLPEGGKVLAFVPRQKKKGRPAIVYTKARLRLPYWYSTLPRAEVIHVAEWAQVIYHTEAYYAPDRWYSPMPPFHDRFEVKMRALCKEWYRMPKGMRGADADKVAELLMTGRRMCPGCMQHRHLNQKDIEVIDEKIKERGMK